MFALRYFNNSFFEMRFFPKGYLSKFTPITSNSTVVGTAISGSAHSYSPITSDAAEAYVPMEQE